MKMAAYTESELFICSVASPEGGVLLSAVSRFQGLKHRYIWDRTNCVLFIEVFLCQGDPIRVLSLETSNLNLGGTEESFVIVQVS